MHKFCWLDIKHMYLRIFLQSMLSNISRPWLNTDGHSALTPSHCCRALQDWLSTHTLPLTAMSMAMLILSVRAKRESAFL